MSNQIQNKVRVLNCLSKLQEAIAKMRDMPLEISMKQPK